MHAEAIDAFDLSRTDGWGKRNAGKRRRRGHRHGSCFVLFVPCVIELTLGFSAAGSVTRHARPCAGHPRLFFAKTWMVGTSPAMTRREVTSNRPNCHNASL